MGLKARIWASRMGFGPQGWDLGLKAGFGPQSWDLGLKAGVWFFCLGFEPQGRDLDLKAGIWATRLGYRWGGDGWRRRRKNFCICKSIGHQPFQGRSLKSWKIYIPDTYFLCPCPSAHENFVAVHCLFDLAIHFFNELTGKITDKLNDELIDKLVNWLIS